MRRIARLAVCVALTALTAAAPAEAALPPMMGTDDVHQGMHGKAYTVVDSSGRIRTFDVSVTGILDNGNGSDRRILAKYERKSRIYKWQAGRGSFCRHKGYGSVHVPYHAYR